MSNMRARAWWAFNKLTKKKYYRVSASDVR